MAYLTDTEKKKLMELISEGKPLPSLYKGKLFTKDDATFVQATKDYRLVYDGKARREEVIANTPEAPFQLIRSFNQDNPFPDGWRNMLVYGDNLLALKELYADQRAANRYGTKGRIKLIYIDPPFATKQDFMKDREKAYRDKVVGSQFIEFLRKRLCLLHGILADDGSIYVHLDTKKGHYIKAVLDEVFGEENFRNEIIWKRSAAHSDNAAFANIHDTVLLYTKTERFTFNSQYVAYDVKYASQRYKHRDEDGRRYMDDNLTAMGLRGRGYDYEWKGVRRIWRCPPETMERYEAENRLYYTRKGVARVKRYLDEMPGLAQQDVWLDVFPVNSQATERENYPTQKPEALLERVVKCSSSEGDIVLDCFAGSGTTAVVAEKLNRRWIAVDSGRLAIYTVQKRMVNLTAGIRSGRKDERNEAERVADLDGHLNTAPGILFVTEKARKGECSITVDLLRDLAEVIKKHDLARRDAPFSVVCPEHKLKIPESELEEPDDETTTGQKQIKVQGIQFAISFIEAKEKQDKEKPLRAKEFALFSAGVYDNEAVKQMRWEEYRPFVMKLFQVREHEHSIKGFRCDGYIGVHSAFVWNYPDHKNLTVDYDYVKSLHETIGGSAGAKFYVIAPIVSMGFAEDECKVGKTTYVFLKVPISILMRLIESGEVGALKQPTKEADVNEVIDAIGFDFVSQPQAKWKCTRERSITMPLLKKKDYVIHVTEFRSKTLATDPEDFANFETFSMAMVDTDYDGQVFRLSEVFWADDLVAAEIKRVKATGADLSQCKQLSLRIPDAKFAGQQMMVILCDRYGNEKKLVFRKGDFR